MQVAQEANEEKRSLFETLRQSFLEEVIEPFGVVTVIPIKAFKSQWKERLESEGIKIYTNNYGSQICYFLKKSEKKQNQGSSVIEESSIQPEPDSKPSPVKEKKPWTLEERQILMELYSEGASVQEISQKLHRSIFSVAAAVRHLPEPLKRKYTTKPKADPEIAAAQASLDDSIIKEFLLAATVLYPKYRRASAFLLKEISSKMETTS